MKGPVRQASAQETAGGRVQEQQEGSNCLSPAQRQRWLRRRRAVAAASTHLGISATALAVLAPICGEA